MLFNSYIFILFMLPLTVIVYYGLNYVTCGIKEENESTNNVSGSLATLKNKRFSLCKQHTIKPGLWWLFLMSLWFYGYFNPSYIILILGSIIFNFFLTKGMDIIHKKQELQGKSLILKVLLILGLLFNLGLLFYFKYIDFFIENMNLMLKGDWTTLNILLPLGISFFTFQQVSYVIDSYGQKIKTQYHFIEYATFVSFFPQLVAGPIVLHSELIPQLQDTKKKTFDYDNFAKGLYSFAMGLGKKVLLADTLSKIVAVGYLEMWNLNTLSVWVIMLSYTLQLYFDFSGYCDMAMGIGWMFNIKLPQNFFSPYKAKSISEFWKRWHITLTRFFTTYVYIPLGGNRKGNIRKYCNTLVVFFLSGLWHGANWTFVLWGVLHGSVLTIEKIAKDYIKVSKKIPFFIKKIAVGCYAIITFYLINVGFVIFRSETIEEAKFIISKLWIPNQGMIFEDITDLVNDFIEIRCIMRIGAVSTLVERLPYLPVVIILMTMLGFVFLGKNTEEKVGFDTFGIKRSLFTILILVWCVVSLSDVSEFLYFNF
ncbi:MAG: MBOAT family O-acyltransferase [Eubacteriales bacterium]